MERIRLNTLRNILTITELKEVNPKALEKARKQKELNDAMRKELGLQNKYCLTSKQVSKIKDCAVFLKITKKDKSYINFWTITTQQINNNMSDKQISSNLSKMFDNYIKQGIISNRYIWVAERQKNGSLHYHIIVEQLKKVDFDKTSQYLNSLFPLTNTNVINIQTEKKEFKKGMDELSGYMTKQMSSYLTKEGKKETTNKNFFEGKASRISNTLLHQFEDNKDSLILEVSSNTIDYEKLSQIIEKIEPFKTDFSFIYNLTPTKVKKIIPLFDISYQNQNNYYI